MSVRNKIKRLIVRDGCNCWLCKNIVDTSLHYNDPMAASIDHYVPRSWGGRNSDENCKLAHRKCNGERVQTFPETLIFTKEEIARLTYPNQQDGGLSKAAMKGLRFRGIDMRKLEVYHRAKTDGPFGERSYHPEMPIEKL